MYRRASSRSTCRIEPPAAPGSYKKWGHFSAKSLLGLDRECNGPIEGLAVLVPAPLAVAAGALEPFVAQQIGDHPALGDKVRMNVRTVRELIAVAVVDDPIADISLHPGTRHLDEAAIVYCHGELLEDTSRYLCCSLGKSRRITFTQKLVEGLRTDKSHRIEGELEREGAVTPGSTKDKFQESLAKTATDS